MEPFHLGGKSFSMAVHKSNLLIVLVARWKFYRETSGLGFRIRNHFTPTTCGSRCSAHTRCQFCDFRLKKMRDSYMVTRPWLLRKNFGPKLQKWWYTSCIQYGDSIHQIKLEVTNSNMALLLDYQTSSLAFRIPTWIKPPNLDAAGVPPHMEFQKPHTEFKKTLFDKQNSWLLDLHITACTVP